MKDEDELPEDGTEDSTNDPAGKERNEQDEQQQQDFLERLKRLSDEADANAEGRQSSFDFPEAEEDDEFEPVAGNDLQNPKESYDLYYTIRRILMRGLPTGPDNKDLRQMVYDEKNLFLRSGVDRPLDGSKVGADSRQALLSFLRDAYTKTQDWERRGGSAYDIFLDYYDLNKKMRFR
jgi:hypothetical protein